MTTEKKGRPFGTSPESERHKLLKQFVAENPHLVGAADDWEVQLELALPTLDEIDVFFRSADVCIAVEVKSAVSDSFPWDYRRGLYQVVKYRALLESMRHEKSLGIPPQIDVLLVLESSLPKKFCSLAQKLCVRIVPNVKVSADLTSSG